MTTSHTSHTATRVSNPLATMVTTITGTTTMEESGQATKHQRARPCQPVTLERPVNVGVTVILNWSGFSIVTKEMGHARSSPAFSYYTGITPPMTILPSLPTVKGFTVNNLRGSVRYLWCPLAAA